MTVTSAAIAFRPEILAGLAAGTIVTFHPSLPAHSQRLMATLGVLVRFDETAPTGCDHEEHRAQ